MENVDKREVTYYSGYFSPEKSEAAPHTLRLMKDVATGEDLQVTDLAPLSHSMGDYMDAWKAAHPIGWTVYRIDGVLMSAEDHNRLKSNMLVLSTALVDTANEIKSCMEREETID